MSKSQETNNHTKSLNCTKIIPKQQKASEFKIKKFSHQLSRAYFHRDHRATLRLGEGASLVIQYWRGIRHFFLLTLNSFKNIGGHVPPAALLRSPPFQGKVQQTCLEHVSHATALFPHAHTPKRSIHMHQTCFSV